MADQNELAELISKLQKAEARATAAEGELAKVNATFGENIKKLNEKVKLAEAQVGEVKLAAEMDRTLMADGITDEAAIDYIRYSYSRAPKVGETAPSFTDFYGTYKEEKKDFLASFRPAAKAAPAATSGAGEKAPPVGPYGKAAGAAAVAGAGTGAKVIDPAIGVGGKAAPEAAKGAPAAIDANQLASMKPADAMAHLRAMGLKSPAAPTASS